MLAGMVQLLLSISTAPVNNVHQMHWCLRDFGRVPCRKSSWPAEMRPSWTEANT